MTSKRHLLVLSAVLALALLASGCSRTDSAQAQVGDDEIADCLADGSCSAGPGIGDQTGGDETGDGQSEVDAVGELVADGSYRGMPVGLTADGYPFIGDPDAPVTVVEFSDYLCPFCFRHTTETTPQLMDQYGTAGEVNFVFRHFPLADLHPTAPSGHAAAQCVTEQGAELFWIFHETLFENQPQWVNLADPSGYLAQTAQEAGADMTAYQDCVESGRAVDLVSAQVAQAQDEGFNGTPSFRLVENRAVEQYDLSGAPTVERFRAALDALLAGEDLTELGETGGAQSLDDLVAPTFNVDPDEPDRYEGWHVGFTDEGLPFIGDPEAPVSVIEYSDYLCPFCFRHTTQTTPALLEEYASANDVNFVFSDFPLQDLHPTAPVGHEASLCVAEQGPAYFWAFHDTLFFDQPSWAGLADPSEYLAEQAETLGVDMNGYQECLDSGRVQDTLDERIAIGRNFGFDGTPSFRFVDNESGDAYPLVGAQPLETIRGYIEALIAGEEPPGAAPQELPFWANEDGLQSDADRPGYTLAGDAFKGDLDAPVVVVEFGDFQCEECGVHAREVQPAVDEALVDTGQVRWVYKHLPRGSEISASIGAAAAECAGEQGAFWEMHGLLYESVESWSIDQPEPVLADLASELGLDAAELIDA